MCNQPCGNLGVFPWGDRCGLVCLHQSKRLIKRQFKRQQGFSKFHNACFTYRIRPTQRWINTINHGGGNTRIVSFSFFYRIWQDLCWLLVFNKEWLEGLQEFTTCSMKVWRWTPVANLLSVPSAWNAAARILSSWWTCTLKTFVQTSQDGIEAIHLSLEYVPWVTGFTSVGLVSPIFWNHSGMYDEDLFIKFLYW